MEVSNAGADAPQREGVCAETAEGTVYARILGVRLGRFVEFEYSLDDGLLSIELILPLAAFQEFCRARDATVLAPAEPEQASQLERLAWREKQPGLLQSPNGGNGQQL